MPRVVVPWLLLILSVPAAASEPADVARAYYQALSRGDVAAAAEWWQPEGRPKVLQQATRRSRARCETVLELETATRTQSAGKAEVALTARSLAWPPLAGSVPAPRTERLIVRLEAVEGTWRIAATRIAEDELVLRLVDVPPETREALIDESGLRGPELARALTRQAVTFSNANRLDEATQFAALAREMAAAAGDLGAEADALSVTSILVRRTATSRADLPRGRDIAATSLAMAELSGDPGALARVLLRYGRALGTELEVHSREPFERILALNHALEDASPLGFAASQLAKYYSDQWRGRESFHYTYEAARFAEESGNVAAILNAELNLAGAAYAHSDFEVAIATYQRAADRALEAGFRSTAAFALRAKASANARRGHIAEAIADSEAAVCLVDEVDGDTKLIVYGVRSGLAARFESPERAEYWIGEFARVRDSAPHPGDDVTLHHRAALALRLGRHEEALAYEERAASAPEGRYNVLNLVRAWRHLGRLHEAIELLTSEIEKLEQSAEANASDAAQQSEFLSAWQNVYGELALALVAAGRTSEALHAAERLKGRVLRQGLEARQGDEGKRARDEKRAELERRIVQLNREVGLAPARSRAQEAAKRRLAEARLELASFRDLDAQTRLPDVPADLPKLPAGTVVIEYLVQQETTLVFVLSAARDGTTRVTSHLLPRKQHDVHRDVNELAARLLQRDLGYGEVSRLFYDRYVRPLGSVVSSARVLCVIPDGPLWQVPFHALRAGGNEYLQSRAVVYYAPSIAFLQPPARPARATRELLAVANPARDRTLEPLPEAAEEVRAVASRYDRARRTVYVGGDVRESVIKREMEHYRVVHIAGHSVIDDRWPMFSAVVLASPKVDEEEDGFLEAREIAGLRLNADLAVLSACETARGRIGGEGVVGLSWALMVAGCPRVAVSQWKAESAATAKLMAAFHRHYRRTGDAAAAMQSAQKLLMRDMHYRHPFYWAPFVVVGAR